MDQQSYFKNRRAIVTGAGSGIGRALALKLIRLGVHVIAVGRTESNLASLRDEIAAGELHLLETVQVDLADWQETREKLAQHCRSTDFLVNSAGYGQTCRVEQQPVDELDRTIDVNLKAPLNLIQMVAAGMKERKFGSIVNVSSVAALVGLDEHVAYAASKAALDMVTKVCAKEFAPHNVRVNSVNPTVVWTKLAQKHWGDPANKASMLAKIPMGRFVELAEVVEPIVHLLGAGAGMVTGVTLPIDGGFTAT